MAQYDHADTYIIPPNFAKEGTLFSGRAEARNVVEAALVALQESAVLCFYTLESKEPSMPESFWCCHWSFWL